MEDMKELFGKGLFYTKLSRIELIDAIGASNGVRRGTVYKWMNTDDAISRGRLRATLEALIEEAKQKGA